MAIYKVYRNSDLIIHLHLKDADGKPYRIKNTVRFVIRFFTTDQRKCLEANYSIHKGKKNLSFGKYHDHVVFPQSELKKIKDGILFYIYEVTFTDLSGKDCFYTETIQGQTEIILKTRIKDVK